MSAWRVCSAGWVVVLSLIDNDLINRLIKVKRLALWPVSFLHQWFAGQQHMSTPTPPRFAQHLAGASHGSRPSFGPPTSVGGEEGRLRPALPRPRRAGERWFAKQTGVGAELIYAIAL